MISEVSRWEVRNEQIDLREVYHVEVRHSYAVKKRTFESDGLVDGL